MTASPPITELHFDDAPNVDEVPGPRSRALRERQRAAESSAVLYPTEMPIAFHEGRGATLEDVDGNRYLDFFGGISVLNVGHCNPYVTEAAAEQTRRLPHSLDFPTEPRLDLIEKLDAIAPGDMAGASRVVFGGPTGSDAVEGSIKLAKQYTGNRGMVAFYGAFHGETSGAYSLTADGKYKADYTPLLAEVEHAQYPYPFRQDGAPQETVDRALEDVKTLLADRYGAMPNPAGVWVEPIQGEGGIVVPPAGFMSGLRDLCDDHDVPLIVDEIQTGMGRTGEWWASDHFDVTPDAMTVGKGVGNGHPLSATVYREELDTWGPGGHTGTFRGYNVAMRAALRSIEYVEDHDLLDHATELGTYIRKRLARVDSPLVGQVRGMGLFVGAEFVDEEGRPAPDAVGEVRQRCLERGVLAWGGGRDDNVLRLLPPLVMTHEQAEVGLDIVCDAIERVSAGRD
ncbi:aspartate aminotransferase family protein [Halosimplex salinum]|uniref:aspartate aminotransferase family protein n=1 Tax=Halosimplex salinum TaxID=1710538 RepID=UPI000F4A45BC|nr:aspartate aminotransferase family protein [Halosimplex salinum]